MTNIKAWHGRLRTSAVWQHLLVEVGHLVGAWGHNSIVVLSSYRSGSSLMMNFLHSHPTIRAYGEILNSEEGVYGNFNGSCPDRVLLHLRAMYLDFPGRMRAAKIIDVQLEELGLGLKDVLDALRMPNVLAVYRRDLLAAYTSQKIAERNGIWYSLNRVNSDRIRVNANDLEDYALNARRRWHRNISVLRDYERGFIVAYEDLDTRRDVVMCDVFNFLGLAYATPITETVRQNPDPLESRIENYRELGLSARIARGDFMMCLGREGRSIWR